MRARSQERRHQGRPQNGDSKHCPKCHALSLEFNDHYRFEGVIVPAWVCDAPPCRYRELVRHSDAAFHSRHLIRESKETQARAKRRMMKSRAVRTRSGKQIEQSEQRLRKR
jgi:hypothetical protein